MSHQTFLRFCLLTEPDHHGTNEQKNSNDQKGVIERHNIGLAPHNVFHLGVGLLGRNNGIVALTYKSVSESLQPLLNNRTVGKRRKPSLKDFRYDKFIVFDPEYGDGYEHLLRRFRRQFGGFEPEIRAMANSPESLISMIAAGRGVFLGLEIAPSVAVSRRFIFICWLNLPAKWRSSPAGKNNPKQSRRS
jgi:hypothetical protein